MQVVCEACLQSPSNASCTRLRGSRAPGVEGTISLIVVLSWCLHKFLKKQRVISK